MEQTVIILLLILLIIIALNYKKIKYNKFYKNFLNYIKDMISTQIKDLKKKHKNKTSNHKRNKHKSKQEENEIENTMNDDEITIGDILRDQDNKGDNKSNLTDVSSIDLSTLESDKSNDDSVLSFD